MFITSSNNRYRVNCNQSLHGFKVKEIAEKPQNHAKMIKQHKKIIYLVCKNPGSLPDKNHTKFTLNNSDIQHIILIVYLKINELK